MANDLRSDETKFWHGQITQAVERERERCAKIADTEPEPDGPMPVEFNRENISDIVRGTVRATRNCIAARIRASGANQ